MAAEMKLFLTLDYELFLGKKSGTPENCLIRPMEELCRVAEKHDIKYVIFVDAAYLMRMQQLRSKYVEVERQYTLVCNHVRSLAERGHDVQLHFHPQWLYSGWDESEHQWKMDRDHYKLSDLAYDEAKSALTESKKILDGIIGYNTTAFRAGGFCLDDFTTYRSIFKELGIIVDSSVARQQFVSSPIHYYDYRNIPSEQVYRFDRSIKEMDGNGEFVELSISSVKWSFLNYYLRIRPVRANFAPSTVYKDGEGIIDDNSGSLKKYRQIFGTKNIISSIDWEWSNLLTVFYRYAERNKQKELVFLGHPKNASDLSISNLNAFLTNTTGIEVKTTKSLI